MIKCNDKSPYRKRGRLEDVIAALQVMASSQRPEREIVKWAHELDRKSDEATVEKWTKVFQEHCEFFLTYHLPNESDLKAALRLRYAFRNHNSKTGHDYTPSELRDLSKDQRKLLTTKPLVGDQLQTLLNTAIELHARAIEESRESRWWIPVFAALLAFVGGLLGALLSDLLGGGGS